MKGGIYIFDGNQVIRFDNKYKAQDLGGLGKELTERKGTGNYDKTRTPFNINYVPLTEKNLASQVYSTIYKNNIYFNDSKKVNLLNGAIITSGPEFFQKLGLKFKDSGRIYLDGNKEGQPVLIPDIKSKDDIPEKVINFFNDSYKFLEDFVGKENIVYASVHLDEDTPHLHFYFLPVVDKVQRKIFETDSNGGILKQEIVSKDGSKKLVPIQKKDDNGKNIYKTEYGKFLNCDQFWKDKGGKMSFAKVQDDFNEYINSKGYNLFRGNKGLNKLHKSTEEKKFEDLQKQISILEKELDKNKSLNELEIQINKEIKNIHSNELYNPTKRKLGGYKENDVNELIDYSKQIQKDNIINEKNLKEKDSVINNLSNEIEKYKNGTAIKERDELIEKQKDTINNQNNLIKEKNSIIFNLENQIKIISKKLEKFIKFCDKVCRAFAHKIGLHYSSNSDVNFDEIELYATQVNNKYEGKTKDKSDDFELGM